MAELTDLDRECLEYETGFLSGLVLCASDEPEKLNRYASRYAIVLALLGRVKESGYYDQIAKAAARRIGRTSLRVWDNLSPSARLFTGRKREQWLQDATDSMFEAADTELSRIRTYSDAFRKKISRHFTKAGARR